MRLIATSLDAVNVGWGAHHPQRFGINPDWSVDVPRFAVPDLLASGKFKLPEGEKNDIGDVRSELEKAAPHEIDLFLNSKADPDNPNSNVETHYFNATKHPLSNKARQLGADDVADELDNLFQQHHTVVLKKSRGVIAHVTPAEKLAYALAYHDAEATGRRPPSVPWRQKGYVDGKF